ncbi:MAG: hypothetical protein HKN21_04430, partial [Candidatus Eisenbacteria bacterium]|nr:hypothetical protein [Candidatus Eisenbacteria bacterium]
MSQQTCSGLRGTIALPTRIPALAIYLFSMVFVLVGCSSDSETAMQSPNLSPSVRLTSGPVEGSLNDYRIRVEWAGNDPDGFV